MRKILFVAATLLIAGAAGIGPTEAREYPWCTRMPLNGGNPECNFTTFAQCQATVSGTGGTCMENPALAYKRVQGNGGLKNNGGYGSGWNSGSSGWNDTGSGWNHSDRHGGNDRRW